MIFYLLLMLGILAVGYLARNAGNGLLKTYVFITGLLLFALMAFKDASVGNDTPSYIEVFNQFQYSTLQSLFEENTTRFETGYIILNRFIACFTSNYQWLFIITAAFTTFSLVKMVTTYAKDVVLSLFLFVSLRFFYFFISGIRQSIAIAILFFSLSSLFRRKFWPFAFWVVLASCFHFSAIVFIVLYPLVVMKWNTKNTLWLTLITLFGVLFFQPIILWILRHLPNYYTHYMQTEYFEGGKSASLLNVLVIFAVVLLALFAQKSKRIPALNETSPKEGDTFRVFMLLALSIAIISVRASLLDRIYLYFWIFSIVYIPNVISRIADHRSRLILKFGVVICTVIYNCTILYYRPEWNHVVPYVFMRSIC